MVIIKIVDGIPCIVLSENNMDIINKSGQKTTNVILGKDFTEIQRSKERKEMPRLMDELKLRFKNARL
ncbi:MAG: hypothetical protein EU539_10520 [Promethearchaeota archaeon]|nr:MAG: hypothetical protein EU539_10520 [Candidatus Lokiarchaeota archaeon]